MRILLIEDEPGLSETLCHALKMQNYDATACLDGESGLDEALTGLYDAIILDILLPKKNGFEVLHQLRSEKISTPVLILTALTEVENRVKGLDAGADYYLTKPFEMTELMACLRAITRRPNRIEEENPEFGDLQLQMRHGGVKCTTNDLFVKMSLKELRLVEILIRAKGSIVPKEELIQRIWGLEDDSEYNHIEVYVSFVRKKLSLLKSKITIKATRGLGYALELAQEKYT